MSLETIEDLEKKFTDEKKRSDRSVLANQIGVRCCQEGKFQKSRRWHQRELNLAVDKNDRALANRGLFEASRYDSEIDTDEEMSYLQEYEKNCENDELQRFEKIKGSYLLEKKDLENAKTHLERSIELAQKVSQVFERQAMLASSQIDLAKIAFLEGDMVNADRIMKSCLYNSRNNYTFPYAVENFIDIFKHEKPNDCWKELQKLGQNRKYTENYKKIKLTLLIAQHDWTKARHAANDLKLFDVLKDLNVLKFSENDEHIADAFGNLEFYDKAIKHYKLAAAKLPTFEKEKIGDLWFSIAECYEKLKNYQQAVKAYEKELTYRNTDSKSFFTTQVEIACLHVDISEGRNFENFSYLHSQNLSPQLKGLLLKRWDEKAKEYKVASQRQDSSLFIDSDYEAITPRPVTPMSEDFGAVSSTDDELLKPEIEKEGKLSRRKTVKTTSKKRNGVYKMTTNENGESLLHVKAKLGKSVELKRLITAGHPINVYDAGKWTPLQEAASYGFLPCVKLLVEAGAKLEDKMNNASYTALMDAVISCDKCRTKDNCGHKECFRFLFQAGASVNHRFPETNEAVWEVVAGRWPQETKLLEQIKAKSKSNIESRPALQDVTNKSPKNTGTVQIVSDDDEIFEKQEIKRKNRKKRKKAVGTPVSSPEIENLALISPTPVQSDSPKRPRLSLERDRSRESDSRGSTKNSTISGRSSGSASSKTTQCIELKVFDSKCVVHFDTIEAFQMGSVGLLKDMLMKKVVDQYGKTCERADLVVDASGAIMDCEHKLMPYIEQEENLQLTVGLVPSKN